VVRSSVNACRTRFFTRPGLLTPSRFGVACSKSQVSFVFSLNYAVFFPLIFFYRPLSSSKSCNFPKVGYQFPRLIPRDPQTAIVPEWSPHTRIPQFSSLSKRAPMCKEIFSPFETPPSEFLLLWSNCPWHFRSH